MAEQLPPVLERLRADAANWGFFAGHFKFDAAGAESARRWFDGNHAVARFRVFGRERDGALYALWLRDGCTVEQSPVAYLGSEGDARVIASSVEEFLGLLALDVDDLGAYATVSETAQSAGHAFLLSWLQRQGLAAASDPDELAASAASARLAHPGLARFIARAMSGKEAPEEDRRPGAVPTPPTTIPSDPIELLNRPRPTVRFNSTSGLEVEVGDDGLITTVWIRSGSIGTVLRPLGLDLLGMKRAEVLQRLGVPGRQGKGWYRYDQGDVAIHVEFGASEQVGRVTLMWIPDLPKHLE